MNDHNLIQSKSARHFSLNHQICDCFWGSNSVRLTTPIYLQGHKLVAIHLPGMVLSNRDTFRFINLQIQITVLINDNAIQITKENTNYTFL
jgi:hypothetical protein